MDSDFIKDRLVDLEKSIRYLVKDSEWILLESINDELLDDYQYLADYRPQVQSPIPARPNIKRPVSIAENSPQPQKPSIIARQKPAVVDQKPVAKIDRAPITLDPMEATNLDSLKLRLKDCSLCQLCQNRSTVVFGQGDQKADLVFIGEGPGEEEDRSGIAFVGRAGKLLTQMIHSIGLNREAVYICNIVKCRPPGNRNPTSDEITACYPFLKKQIDFLNPKLIVTMGNVATKTIIPDALGIMKMRGRMIDYNGIPLIPTFHPSYLLRNPNALSDVWIDMRKIRQALHQQNSNSRS